MQPILPLSAIFLIEYTTSGVIRTKSTKWLDEHVNCQPFTVSLLVNLLLTAGRPIALVYEYLIGFAAANYCSKRD